MNIKINQAKNKITIGKQSIELTLKEMQQLRDELDKVLGRPHVPPVVFPPYQPVIIEDGPLNPEKPWREYPYKWPKDDPDYPKVWCRQPGEKSDVKIEMNSQV